MTATETPMTISNLESAIDRYNDSCRVLALHAFDYARNIGTKDESYYHRCLLAATEEVRLAHLDKCAVFENDPSEYARKPL